MILIGGTIAGATPTGSAMAWAIPLPPPIPIMKAWEAHEDCLWQMRSDPHLQC